MTTNERRDLATPVAVLAGLLAALSLAVAQPVRVTERLDASKATVLTGNRPPKALPEDDQGPLDFSQIMSGITIELKPSAHQADDLREFLEQQRIPSSPDYHRWLTPEQYATRFGVSSADLQQVTGWLQTEGFSVDYVARARTWVMFSGTAGRVGHAFRTEIDRYNVEGKLHFANRADPSIPSALAPVVLLIRGLDDIHTSPSVPIANFTATGGAHYLVPGDLATIYNVAPLYQRGITGSGQKVVIPGQTDIHLSDIEHFRAQYGLPVNDPTLVLVTGTADPGVSADDLVESSLDVEYSGALAPNATILFVYSPDVWTSVQFAIDQALAPVISFSYGFCEQLISSTPSSTAAFIQTLAQTGNSMGITWVTSSGDTGAADCDLTSEQVARQGLAVDLPASVPEITGVGGTEFAEGSGTYWGQVNNANGSSALSYIPEMGWNDTAAVGELLASGGGASVFFPKPTWQLGPGVPSDGARDVPDIAFTAGVAHDPYVIYTNGAPLYVGGTSAPAPVFGGMLALLNQYLASSGGSAPAGLGNINPALYRLSQSTPGIFHDVTTGSNIVPCASGTPNCAAGHFGFEAGAGYDQVTGLGSMNFYNLVLAWNASQPIATTTALTASTAILSVDGSTVLTATVQGAAGTASPTGTVTFTLGAATLGVVALSGSGGVATALLTVNGSQLASGANNATATYGGSALFSPSSGALSIDLIAVTVGAVSVTPSSGSGASQSFALEYTDTGGAVNLQTAWVYFNATLANPASNACLVYYGRAANQINLLADNGSAWQAATLGSAVTLRNSQCSLNAAASTVAVGGNILTLTVAMTFQPTSAPAKNIYLYAADNSGITSGWQQRGTWTVTSNGSAPVPVSVTPSSGSGASQSFAFQFSDTAGASSLQQVWVYFNATLANPATNACLLYYNAASHQVNLLAATGTAWQVATLGAAVTLQNGECSINMAATTAVLSGSTLTLNMALAFQSAFDGAKNVYLYAVDSSGVTSGWQQLGLWAVTGSAGGPAAVSAVSSGGPGTSLSFALDFSDSPTAANLQQVWVYFNATLANPAVNACLFSYTAATNQVSLLDDNGTSWQAAALGSSTTLQNGYCAIDVATSTIQVNGATLTWNMGVSLFSDFAGVKNIYLYAVDVSGATSGWQNLGAWTVPQGGFQSRPEAF